MHPSSNVVPRKQLCACHAYECVWDACNVTDAGSGKEHTAGQRKQVKQNTIIILSCLVTSNTREAHKSPRLSAGTHSPHTPLQPRVVHASADTVSSSGTHTHAELLRLPSISRRGDGARVVVVVGASVVVVLGASGAVVVVVVVVVLVVVAADVSAKPSPFVYVWSVASVLLLCVPCVSAPPSPSFVIGPGDSVFGFSGEAGAVTDDSEPPDPPAPPAPPRPCSVEDPGLCLSECFGGTGPGPDFGRSASPVELNASSLLPFSLFTVGWDCRLPSAT
ncbi:hypothetical protein MOQ_005528 [Trypanosoma cruzi marinkellei]|uniref:Uncharacterized protein n=1 Tax=Trypanosoma cruzi marinkellei TaxID=85056 RepID=K2NP83_TRYCR|nr:hypothetical protein MOQ_005528 [Trypanosoma cruzi marinkellei]